MNTSIASRILATTFLCGSMAAPAWAQDNPQETGATNSGDIIVTARRVEERLQDVPISITVFNQQQLSNRNVTNAQDLAAYTPSLSATSTYGSEQSTFALRGFVQETGTGPSVGVYFADVVAPRGGAQGFPAGDGAGPGAFFDLQNVQVLKGPQGTLFGRNTTGGAVLLVPQKPTNKLEGYIEGSVGNYDMYRVQGVLNVPLAETLRLRLGADHQKRDGYMINGTGIGARDFDDVDYVALRGSLVWDVTPNIENYTVASYTNSHNNGHVQKLIACNSTPSPANFLGLLGCTQLQNEVPGFYRLSNDVPDPFSKLRQWQIVNTTTWQASDNLTVKNITSYAKVRLRVHSDLFGTAFKIPQGAFVPAIPGVFPGYPATATPVGFAQIRSTPDIDAANETTFTEEFRLQGNSAGGKLEWQAGGYYENATPNGFIGSQSPVFIGCSDPDNFICTDLTGAGVINYTVAKNSARTIGVYAQSSYALTDKLKLTGGIRYTWDRIRSISRGITYTFPVGVPDAPSNAHNCTITPLPSQPNSSLPNCEFDRQASFKAPTWLIGLDYKPSDDVLLYAKYSRGYRTGGIKSDVPEQFIVFQPEHVDTYEVGAKTSFNGFIRGNFNISGFYNNFRNQQLQLGFNTNFNRTDPATGAPLPTIAVTPTAGPVNVGKSRIWGIELDTRLHLFEGFVLEGAYTYLNTKVLSATPPSLPSDSPYVLNTAATVGDVLILSPKHKLTVSGTYTLPLDESLGEISVGATFSYSSSQRANYSNRTFANLTGGVDLGVLAPRNLLNLNLNWASVAGGPFDLSLFVTNVTKEKYYTWVPGLIGSAGIETASVGEPRMFGARVKFRFGD